MKITIGGLRKLIRELYESPTQKAIQVTQHVVDVAEDYVDSLVAGKPDKRSEHEFKELADQAASLAQWMLKKQLPKAEDVAKFAWVASKISDESGFWKRPTFLGSTEYIEKMQGLLRKLNTAAVGVLSN